MFCTYRLTLERFGARHDLDQLLGDRRLPGAVVLRASAADHVLGCCAWRDSIAVMRAACSPAWFSSSARKISTSSAFGTSSASSVSALGSIVKGGLSVAASARLGRERQQLHDARPLRDRADELRVHEPALRRSRPRGSAARAPPRSAGRVRSRCARWSRCSARPDRGGGARRSRRPCGRSSRSRAAPPCGRARRSPAPRASARSS